MPHKNSRKKEPPKESRIPSKFKQDIAGILLIAVAVFIFIANLSPSTGLLGLFVIKKALRSVIGVGIYLLPFFIGIYGVILLIRQEVKELTVRLFGLLVMFLVFITVAQFAAPDYFATIARYPLAMNHYGSWLARGRGARSATLLSSPWRKPSGWPGPTSSCAPLPSSPPCYYLMLPSRHCWL